MARHAYATHAADETGVATTEVRSSSVAGINLLARLLAVVAAAVPTIVGLIAVARVDWGGPGLDAAAVNVADMVFRPWAAIITLGLGIIALVAAVSWDGASKLTVGAVFVAIGIAVIVANPKIQEVALNDRTGWMYVLVGAVLVLAGLLAGAGWATARRTRPVDY